MQKPSELHAELARRHLLDFVRLTFPQYQPAEHHTLIAAKLEAVERGEIKRLMIFMPPRHGKSELASIRFPAWFLGRNPDKRVIATSYAAGLAYRFSRQARNILSDPHWPFPVGLADDLAQVQQWDIADHRGGYLAAGAGGPITGSGAHLLIIDDPVKNRDEADSALVRESIWEWYTSTAYTRLEEDAAVIVVQTRWHPDDLSGRLLAAQAEGGDQWEVLDLPAISQQGEALWPQKYDLAALERIRSTIGARDWLALYQQTPTAEGGVIFERDWWENRNRFDPTEPRPCVARWLSWDTAMVANESAAYTACCVVELGHDRRLSLREVYRERLTFPNLSRAIEGVAARWNQDGKLYEVIIEDQSSGTSAIQTLQATAPAWLKGRIRGWKPKGSKEERASRAAVWCRNGMVWLPEPSEAVPWLFEFESELGQFPQSQYKDQTDAFSQAVIYLENWLKAGYQAEGVDADAAD